ncbi:MAG: hypothetical protein JWN48_1225 [Myxococcaceae bacterium]|nr:hypothetical protein [Myxococcaceae bacterium]
MDPRQPVKVSPRHAVTLDEDYLALIARAPQQDFVVRTLAKRMAGDMPLMSGELVIAGRSTREAFPLAEAYPLHFRKTYYPGQLRGDPQGEFERHSRASELIGIPPPIGYARGVFRSCLVPGRPFHQVCAFDADPPETNIRLADKLTLAAAAGMWLLCEHIYGTLTTLQRAGMTHGDAELHNFIVCPAPLEVIPIDFDMAVTRDPSSEASEEAWQAHCARDLEPLLKVAIFVQCALGAQPSALGQLALTSIDPMFGRSASAFKRAIGDREKLLSTV